MRGFPLSLALQIEIGCRRFDLWIVFILVERGELVDRIGIQPLGFDAGIALGVGVVGMPISPFSVGESSKRPPHRTLLQTLSDSPPKT